MCADQSRVALKRQTQLHWHVQCTEGLMCVNQCRVALEYQTQLHWCAQCIEGLHV